MCDKVIFYTYSTVKDGLLLIKVISFIMIWDKYFIMCMQRSNFTGVKTGKSTLYNLPSALLGTRVGQSYIYRKRTI